MTARPVYPRRLPPLVAFRAKAVAEDGVGTGGDVFLELFPAIFVILNPFALAADGEQAAEGFDLFQGFLQFAHQMVAFPLHVVLVNGHLDGGDQFPFVQWLEQVSVRLRDLGAFESFVVGVGGEIDHGEGQTLAEQLGGLDAIELATQADEHSMNIRHILVYTVNNGNYCYCDYK